MEKEQLKDDLMLFFNDLAEYQTSKQGQKVKNLITQYDTEAEAIERNAPELAEALAEYWEARNGNGLEWKSEAERQEGRELDEYISRLYSEQN